MKSKYLELMNEDLESKRYKSGAAAEAITVMSNHTHEIFEIQEQVSFSNHMRRHHSRYGSYFNRLKNRSGKVAEDRPHTKLMFDDYRAMETTFYVHANPIRANLVRDAKDYFFSTHRLYAFGKREHWMRNIKLPGWYLRLGRTKGLRQKKYRQLFAAFLKRMGRFKKKFLRARFLGPMYWVKRRERAVKDWLKERPKPAPP